MPPKWFENAKTFLVALAARVADPGGDYPDPT